MAKTPFKTLPKFEKMKPKAGLERRNSTGGATIFNEPIPVPNYLRASIGSCHDLCKNGKRLDSPPQKSELRRNMNLKLASKTNDRTKKIPESKILGFPSSRKKPKETLKSTCSARGGQNGEIKKRSSPPLPRTPSPSHPKPAKIPVSKKMGPSKPLEKTERRKNPQRESVQEKIIDVIEATGENQLVIEAEDGKQNEGFVSSLDQKQEMDSKVEPEREEEVVERENKEEDDQTLEEKRVSRSAFSEGDFDDNNNNNDDKKESVRIIVQTGKVKVRALVHAFETLITT